MPRRGLTCPEQIERLAAQLEEKAELHRKEEEQLKARLQRLENAEQHQQRKLRTRCMIVTGTLVGHG